VATSGSLPLGARFDQFQLDLSSGKLLRSGVPVPIQDQPFQVLRLLLEADGRVVTREQLRIALWPEDTFVDFERGVNTAVKKVRQALEDSAERPTFVETLPKIGYRFLIPVEWTSDVGGKRELHSVVPISPPGPTPVPQPMAPKRSWGLTSGIALVAVAVSASAVFMVKENSYLAHTRWGALLRMLVFGHPPAPTTLTSQRRLTANPDDTPLTAGVISPDGKYLAYSDSTGVYVRQVDGGETHLIPLPKGFDALPESWFPDSAHLVVTWLDKAEHDPPSLWVISMMGGTPRKLADQGSSARVSPDGSQIAFLKGMWDDEEIWVVDGNGNAARKVLDAGDDRFGPTAWAPDGKQFAYVRMSEHSASQIAVYDVTKGQSETILTDPGLGLEIAWVNPSRLIYSLREAQPNQSDCNLWWVELEARIARPSGAPTRITSDREAIASISVTSDGKRMALVRRTSQADVYLAEVEAQGRGLSTPRRFTRDDRQDIPSSWTPDGKALLFFSDRDGPFHIFKQNVDQTQPELLVGGRSDVWLPHMTPDGLGVLYLASPEPGEMGNVRILRIPPSGGPSQLIFEGPGIVNFQCARLPSTVCVYGQNDSDYYRFFIFDTAGGKDTELSAAKVRKEDGMSSWNLSPDGKYLASRKSQNPYEVTELRIFSLTDNSQRYIPVPNVKVVVGIDWAADSKSVLVGGYMGRGSWGTRSGLVNIDLSGKAKTLLEGQNPSVMGGTPSPDGHRLALGANTNSSNAWLLENF
jgi:Tol biopolymer transport system component/DNA-binding winged helix-turn-helix (wHTH) protein